MENSVIRTDGTLLERVTPLFDMVRAAEETIEKERRMPQEITDALYECGMYRAFLPRELGGLEADPVEWLEAVEALSNINGSVGWLCMLHTGQTWAQPEAMKRILEKERWIIAGNGGVREASPERSKADTGSQVGGRFLVDRPKQHISSAYAFCMTTMVTRCCPRKTETRGL